MKVDSGLAVPIQVVTVWHELLHALLEQAGQTDHDESTVITLAYGLVQVICQNPGLIDYTVNNSRG